MAETATPTTPPAPTAVEPVSTPEPLKGDPPAEQGKTPEGFKSPESKDAVLADLAKERDARQALEQQLKQVQDAQKKQNEALASAFGLKQEPNPDDPAETVKSLQEQITQMRNDAADDRYEALKDRLAAHFGIDEKHIDLLTETDPEKLKAQAEKVGALLAAKPGAEQPPAFQANPGQGMGGQVDPAAAEEAEYRKYYPESTPR
jgi:hypothetical protein